MIDAYHALLTPDLAESSHAHLDGVLRKRGLVFGGRPLCTVLRPRLMTVDEYSSLQARAAFRRQDIIVAIGRGDPNYQENVEFSTILWNKGIGNALRIWDGHAHDWPYWEQMIVRYVGGHD